MSKAADLARTASASETALSNRNLIINGAMVLDQRVSGTQTVNANTTFFASDRFSAGGVASDGVFTLAKNTDSPDGFVSSLKATVTTADASIPSGGRYFIRTKLEGYTTSQLNLGSSSAQSFTLSFYVKSSLTGTFGGAIVNGAQNRSYPYSYTISLANTWERKTITIAGDTTGTWPIDNSKAMQIGWSLGVGSTYLDTSGAWVASQKWGSTGETKVIATVNATWYLTGVQMEIGPVATPFEHRSFGQELALCQRYYEKSYDQGDVPGTGTHYGAVKIGGNRETMTSSYLSGGGNTFKVTKRARPTIIIYDPDGGTTNQCQRWTLGVGNYNNQASVSADISETNFLQYSATGNSASGVIYHYTADAEL